MVTVTLGTLALSSALAVAQMDQPAQPQQPTPAPLPGTGTDPAALPSTVPQGDASASMADRDFVKGALQGGMAEVQLGQLALQKSSNSQVQQFAKQMVDDHTKLGNDMLPIAQRLGVTPPKGLSKKDQALMTRLQSLSGSAFDQAYIRAMVKDHKKDKEEFAMESAHAADPQLKDAAMKGESVITMHLQMIQQIAKSQGVSEKGQ